MNDIVRNPPIDGAGHNLPNSATKTPVDWQPIAGLLPCNRQRILASHWSGYYCDWVKDAEFKHGCWMDGLTFLTPTHWAPMPFSPTEFADKRGMGA